MGILVDDEQRRVTFLYKLEEGVSEGSIGLHCAAMCGISWSVVENAEVAAREKGMEVDRTADAGKKGSDVPLGVLSDLAWILREGKEEDVDDKGLDALVACIEAL
jgi:DNA mismatch repair protein MSH6